MDTNVLIHIVWILNIFRWLLYWGMYVLCDVMCCNIGDIVIVTRHIGELAWSRCVSVACLCEGGITSTLLEQPLLLYIIVIGVCSECNIFVCYLCTGNWSIFIVFVMCENTDITLFDVLPVDCYIVVSLWYIVLVKKSQGMQQLMYNCSVLKAAS